MYELREFYSSVFDEYDNSLGTYETLEEAREAQFAAFEKELQIMSSRAREDWGDQAKIDSVKTAADGSSYFRIQVCAGHTIDRFYVQKVESEGR